MTTGCAVSLHGTVGGRIQQPGGLPPGFFVRKMDWLLIGKALCLVAVIEGLAYALAPNGMRDAAEMISRTDARTLRSVGIAAMAIGAVLLVLLSS